MIRAARLLSVTGALVVVLSGCSLQQNIAEQAAATAGPRVAAPALEGVDLDGSQISLSAWRGHPVVVDFWASWCVPCRAEQKDLNALMARYASRGVRFVGVAVRDDPAQARAFRAGLGVVYPSLIDDGERIAAAWNVSAPPTTVVVDSRGQIVDRTLGTVAGLGPELDRLLATP